MRVLSINVSELIATSYKGKDILTGIYKKPIHGQISVRKTNIDGDKQADLTNHGGIDKAVYAFPSEHHAFYQEKLGQDTYEYGQFGENLSTEGMLESAVHIGDRFLIGSAIFEVSQPRTPCFKLAMKMGTPDVVKLMLDSAKTGFYLRIIQEGVIEPGDVYRVYLNEAAPSIEEIHKLMFIDIIDVSGLEKATASSALGRALQEEFSKRLRKLNGEFH